MLSKDVKRAPTKGTADPAELARFDALAEEWWKPDGAFKVVHAFNQVRVAHLLERLPVLLRRPLAGLRMIDVGCGAGLVSEPLSRSGATVIGMDAVERNVLVAERHARSTGAPVEYRHAVPEDFAGQGATFDVVMALEVVEHVGNPSAFLEALARLTTPGGVLVIATLNRTIRSFVKAIVGAEYLLRWLPPGTHDWRKFVTPRELDLGLRHHGFEVMERCGVTFDLMTRQWAVSGDDSATYMQFHRKSDQKA